MITSKRIAELNATYPEQHGAICAACRKAWRVWYDANDRVVGRILCRCEVR